MYYNIIAFGSFFYEFIRFIQFQFEIRYDDLYIGFIATDLVGTFVSFVWLTSQLFVIQHLSGKQFFMTTDSREKAYILQGTLKNALNIALFFSVVKMVFTLGPDTI